VLWPSISRDGRTVVFERDFQIWKLDTRTGQAAPVSITRQGVPAGPSTQRISLAGQWRDVALSPDGKKVALVGHGELFVAALDGGDAVRLTRTPGLEVQPAWSADSRRLVYVSDRGGQPRIFEYDVLAGTEAAITAGPDTSPLFSKDGKRLAFVRNDTELRVLDWDTRQERALAQIDSATPLITRNAGSTPFTWSPDGKWIAFVDASVGDTRNIEIADPTGATPARQVTFLSNRQAGDVQWAPDGAALFFRTGTRTETFRAARVDLVPRTPQFRENQVLDLFRDQGKPAEGGATGNVAVEGIRDRLTLLPVGLDVASLRVSPDGRMAVVISASTGQPNLYAYSLDPLSREPAVVRQLTSTAGAKSGVTFTADGKDVLYLDRGTLQRVPVDASRAPRAIGVNAEMEVDFHQEKMEVFRQSWSYLRDYFAIPDMNGVNWAGVRETYEPLVQGAATPDEMRRLLQQMVGELNASHLGANPPANTTAASTGRLGLRFDRDQYERFGAFVVAEVVPLSPGAVAGVKAGDRLLAVNGTSLDAAANLWALLDGTIGRQVTLKLADREVSVQPVNLAAERALGYRAWVDRNRAYVDRASGGRLGYVHMQSMAAEMLDRLHVDLDIENQSKAGVVIDLRANTGGFVAAHALDVFNRKTYIQVGRRGRTPASIHSWAGQRSLEKPTILVVNQESLSDAEDFTEGYRTFKMGTVVGEPTAGWFIGTNNIELIDGTVFRIAGAQGFASNGENMEMHPRPVDVPVSRPLGESYSGRDSQLDVAVKTLLGQIGSK
jgi:Tol biopolymer transport system component/C-terminal processing protease CtpA/Prc